MTGGATAVLDPLQQRVALPVSVRLYPLGFPLELVTNSPCVAACARESWNWFEQMFVAPPVRLRVAVSSEPASGLPGPPVYRAQGRLLTIAADRENHAACDLESGFGAAWLNSAVLSDTDYLRFYFLEAMAYSMLTARHLTAVHAACVAWNGRGVLLCGASGAGKTSLAYACASRGFAFISDDASSLLRRQPEPVVIGKPVQFRFRGDAAELFPELDGLLCRSDSHGKPSIEVKTADLPDIKTEARCRVDAVVFLTREPGAEAKLQPVPAECAIERLQAELPFLSESSYAEQLASLHALTAAGTYELRYSAFDDAVALLKSLLHER